MDDNFHHDGQALDRLGYVIATGGDVDGDGTLDYLVGSTSIQQGGNEVGGAYVYSGADHSILHTFYGTPDTYFANAAAIGSDVNADGYDDIVIGAPSTRVGGLFTGRVHVYSGADGTEIMQVTPATSVSMGNSLCAAGDVNQDGFDDFLVRLNQGGPAFEGQIQMISGATGLALATATGDASFSAIGFSMANVGDVNGDGINDFAVGSPQSENNGSFWAGDVDLLSGADLSVIWKIESAHDEALYGGSVAAFPDINQDGISEVLIGSPGFNFHYGAFEVRSGVDGALLLRVEGTQDGGTLGNSIANAGDFNSDLVPDILVGEPFLYDSGNADNGEVHIYSGVDGSLIQTIHASTNGSRAGWHVANILGGATMSSRQLLYTSPADSTVSSYGGSCTGFGFNPFVTASAHDVSQSAGGAITYELHFPDDAAGDTYQLLASTNGTGPISFPNGVDVPLSFDTLLAQTYWGILPPIIQNGIGTLDGEGKGTIQLNAPAGVIPASLIGAEYSLAMACRYGLDLWRYSSIAFELTILP